MPNIDARLLNYAIIGSGMMGLEHIRNLVEMSDVRIVGVCDPHTPSLEKARRVLNRMEGVRYFTNHLEMLGHCDADVVVIATPNHTHFNIAKDVLNSGKHMLIEKPLCITVSQCLELQQIEAATSVEERVIWVGLEYRYMAPTARVKLEIDKGAIGKVRMVSVREHRYPFLEKVDHWNRFNANTGGTLVEKCCHFFDLMCVLANSAPVSVMASGSQDVNHLAENYGGRTPDILDNAYVIVNFDNGVRGMLDLCMFAEASKNEQEICVVGDKGKIEALISESVVRIGKRKNGYGTFQDFPIELEKDVVQGFHHGASYMEHRFMQAAIREGQKADIGLKEGLISVAIGQAAHLSIDQGRLVLISELLA